MGLFRTYSPHFDSKINLNRPEAIHRPTKPATAITNLLMKNIITFLLSCLSLTAVIGQVVHETRITVLSKTNTETILSLSLTGIDQHPVSTP